MERIQIYALKEFYTQYNFEGKKGNYNLRIKKVQNDINGNPLYKFQLFRDSKSIIKECKGNIHRCYAKKSYGLIQTYDLEISINNLINKIDLQ